MTWERVHRRNRIVRDIVDREDVRLPLSAPDLHAVREEFDDLADFLLAVHALWARAFDARIDAVLENPPSDPRAALTEVCEGLARDLPGARRILDEYAGDPDLARAAARHDRRVLAATGVDRADIAATATEEPQRVPVCSKRGRLHAVRVALGAA